MATLSAEYHVDSNQKRGIAFFRFFLLMHDCCDLWGQYYFAKENSWAGFGGQERVLGERGASMPAHVRACPGMPGHARARPGTPQDADASLFARGRFCL